MAGPWEKYGQSEDAAKPWEKYGSEKDAAPAKETPKPQDSGLNIGGPFGQAIGAGEAALGYLSPVVGGTLGNIGGMAAAGKEMISPGGGDPTGFAREIAQRFTYEPRTTGGKALLGGLQSDVNPLTLLGKGASWLGDQAQELVSPPGTSGPLRSMLGYGAKGLVEQAPMLAGAGAPGAAAKASGALRGGAERLMHSALKPGVKYAKQSEPAVDLLLEKGINVTPGGLEKIRGEIGDLNSRISKLIENSPASIDKAGVATRLYDTLEKFEKQVDPHADLASIERSWNGFMNHPLLTGKDIPVKTAQELKTGTYTQLKGKYGEMGSAETEAQKTLARGLKEEIAKAVPEVRQLNAEESRLLSALPMVERRVLVSANKNPVGLGVLSMNPKNIAVWMADRSELFKSLVARMLNTGSRMTPSMNVAGPLGGMAVSQQANQIQQPPQ